MLVDTSDDLSRMRKYFLSRIAGELQRQPVGAAISAIGIGYRLSQAGDVLLYFDRRDVHERDGEWTTEMEPESNMLELPAWHSACESISKNAMEIRLPDGRSQVIPAGSDGTVLARAFGEALRLIAMDTWAQGYFAKLNTTDECQLDIEEFDGMWAWPEAFDDLGCTNVLNALTIVRLPK